MRFYAFDGSTGSGRILVSTDGGATFSAGATGMSGRTGRLRATVSVAGDLWVVANGNAYHSTDGGMTVAQLTTALAVYAMGAGMAAPDRPCPRSTSAARQRHRGPVPLGRRGSDLGADRRRGPSLRHRGDILGDPKTYGRVYVGNNGRGILYGDIAN